MLCGKCGKENKDNSKFCTGCGAKLVSVPAEAPAPITVANASSEGVEEKHSINTPAVEEQANVYNARTELDRERAELITKAKKKRTRRIIAISCSIAGAAIVICLAVFLGIPYIKYTQACTALDEGRYDTAYTTFVDLGDFLDSAKMAEESVYRKKEFIYRQGEELLAAKEYDAAYEKFLSIADHEDSLGMANESIYLKGQKLLVRKDYDAAHETFLSIEGYKDSLDMANESMYLKAKDLASEKKYDQAIEIFAALGDYEDSETLLLESKYRKASLLQNELQYDLAYKLYAELSGYKDSDSRASETMYQWVESSILTEAAANYLKNTIPRTEKTTERFYDALIQAIYEDMGYPESYCGFYNSKVVLILLDVLPSTYKDTAAYKEVFKALEKTYSDALFRKHNDLMRKHWNLKLVQDLAKIDNCIAQFLESRWETSNKSYYIEFYQYGSSTSVKYNLPCVAEPYGTKYYDIQDMIFYWLDADENKLAEVYKFDIVNFDTIKVYCYQNGQTYTLYRQ